MYQFISQQTQLPYHVATSPWCPHLPYIIQTSAKHTITTQRTWEPCISKHTPIPQTHCDKYTTHKAQHCIITA